MKELLIKLRNYLLKEATKEDRPEEWRSIPGLCMGVYRMWADDLITYEEKGLLNDYIAKHRPKWYQKHYCFSQRNSLYYWPIGLWLPRMLWVNAQIKKCK